MTAHTPGPWTFSYDQDLGMSEQDDPAGVRVVSGRDGELLLIGSKFYPSTPDTLADWRLIAAAPDLLRLAGGAWHMLQSLLAVREGIPDDSIRQMADALLAAIKKAEGRP